MMACRASRKIDSERTILLTKSKRERIRHNLLRHLRAPPYQAPPFSGLYLLAIRTQCRAQIFCSSLLDIFARHRANCREPAIHIINIAHNGIPAEPLRPVLKRFIMRVVVILDQPLCSFEFILRDWVGHHFQQFLSGYFERSLLVLRLEADRHSEHRPDLSHLHKTENLLSDLLSLLERHLKAGGAAAAKEASKNGKSSYIAASRRWQMEAQIEIAEFGLEVIACFLKLPDRHRSVYRFE